MRREAVVVLENSSAIFSPSKTCIAQYSIFSGRNKPLGFVDLLNITSGSKFPLALFYQIMNFPHLPYWPICALFLFLFLIIQLLNTMKL